MFFSPRGRRVSSTGLLLDLDAGPGLAGRAGDDGEPGGVEKNAPAQTEHFGGDAELVGIELVDYAGQRTAAASPTRPRPEEAVPGAVTAVAASGALRTDAAATAQPTPAQQRRRAARARRAARMASGNLAPTRQPSEQFPERRCSDDGYEYTMAEFIAHYGGRVQWDAAKTLRRKRSFKL